MKSVWSDETGWIINQVDKICCCMLLNSFYLKKNNSKKTLAVIGNWWYDIDSDNILNCPRSNYYFLTQLNQLLDNTTSKCLSMFHCNIRSLPKHLSLLNEFLYSVNRKPDILAITETTIKPDSNKYWYPKLWFLPHQPTKTDMQFWAMSRKILMPFMDLI